MIRNNTVILNETIVGLYSDNELNDMLIQLADYYKVSKSEFIVTKANPYSFV